MSIYAYTGLPGACKTTRLAQLLLAKLEVAQHIYNKTGFIRKVYTNIKLSPLIEKRYGTFIEYFIDVHDMVQWRQCDIFIDELSTYFDSQEWEKLPSGIKRYLKLHRHYNVMIYGIAQDFLTIDKNFRRLTKEMFYLHRVIGTKEPQPHEPAPKHPIVFTIQYSVDKKFWEFEKEGYKYLNSQWHFFTKKDFQIFDTTQELPEPPTRPLKRVQRHWYNNGKIEYTQTRYI